MHEVDHCAMLLSPKKNGIASCLQLVTMSFLYIGDAEHGHCSTRLPPPGIPDYAGPYSCVHVCRWVHVWIGAKENVFRNGGGV